MAQWARVLAAKPNYYLSLDLRHTLWRGRTNSVSYPLIPTYMYAMAYMHVHTDTHK